jgi:Arc/MetJ-type ribon-helix-helix transcriptional regulator
MSNSATHKRRGRGRPATGHDPTITVRLPGEIVEAIVSVAEAEKLSRSEVIRLALEEHLKRKGALPR